MTPAAAPQVPPGVVLYRGPIDVAKHVFMNEGGLVGTYRGIGATLVREIPGNALMFGAYEGAKMGFATAIPGPSGGPRDVAKLSKLEQMLAGGFGGAAFWAVVFPVDVVKSKIQTDDVARPKYGNILQTARVVLKEQGIRGLYAGFSPAMVRAFPANAAAFVAYEYARTALAGW